MLKEKKENPTPPSAEAGYKNDGKSINRLICSWYKGWDSSMCYPRTNLNYSIFAYYTLKTSNVKKKKQREKENILGVNTNSTVHIMVLAEYISISAWFGASTNQPK